MELYSLGNHIVGRSYVFGVLKSFWEMLIFVGCIRMDIGDLRGLSDDWFVGGCPDRISFYLQQ